MKKLLISILIVLLIILTYFAIFNGISFANINILSVGQIIQKNDELTNNIEEVKSLLKKEYASKKEELSSAVSQLLQKKEEYFDLAKISTEGEITKANTEETYLVEYLWTRVGRHATSEGVNINMDVITGDVGESDIKNIKFTVNGHYIAIIQFVSSLEDDSKLNFKIEDFKMNGSEGSLTATFTVRGVRIKTENTSNVVSQDENTQDKNTIEETKTTNTEVTNTTNADSNSIDNTNTVQ